MKPRIGLRLRCERVDANHVAAEWVEVTAATVGQSTLVYLLSGPDGPCALDRYRPAARELARSTGARVLMVDCGDEAAGSEQAALDAGVAAFAWLVGEGSDLALTSFVGNRSEGSFIDDVVEALRRRALPVPAGALLDHQSTGPLIAWAFGGGEGLRR